MKIGTYNVLGLTGFPAAEAAKVIGAPGEVTNRDHFTAVFSGLGCDILALQEGVAARTMQAVARAMNINLATFPSPVNWPGHVLSRYPILESRVFSHMSATEETPPFSRCCGAVLLEPVPDHLLWVVVIHLHPKNTDLRTREANILRDRVRELQAVTADVIVMGDFNSEVDEPVHQNLKAMGFTNAMETVGGGIKATMDTAGKNLRYIDHIYCSPSMATRLHEAKVVRDPGFRRDGTDEHPHWSHSDHLPVVACLQMQGEPKRSVFSACSCSCL
jgi:endonuclease/exonuclease/phosphatase family metal-dependent hydrolase